MQTLFFNHLKVLLSIGFRSCGILGERQNNAIVLKFINVYDYTDFKGHLVLTLWFS